MGEIVRFELRRLSRDFPTVFFSLVFPTMVLLIFGGIYGNDPSPVFNGIGEIDATLPAYAALGVAVTGLMGFPLTVAEYRDRGVLRRLRVTPAKPTLLLVGQLIANVGITAIGIAVLIVTGAVALDAHVSPNWPAFILSLLLTVVSIYGIGLVVASLAPNQRAATIISQIIYFPMIFLSGATVPSELFPKKMQNLIEIVPLTHAVTLLKASWIKGQSVNWPLHIGVLLGVAVVCAVCAVLAFRWS